VINSIYISKSIIEEIRRSPHGVFVDKLAADFLNDGYKPHNLKGTFSIILPFIRWCAHQRISPKQFRKHHASAFIEEYSKTHKPGGNGRIRCLQHLLRLIEREHNTVIIETEIPPYLKSAFVRSAVNEFEAYMQNEKGLTPTSIRRFSTTTAQFLSFTFKSRKVTPGEIDHKTILNFFRVRGAKFHDRTLKGDASALRSYFRFLYGNRKTKNDLSVVVPQIAGWRNQNLIHTVSEAEMIQLLESCDQSHAIGVRDYAILLLLIRYGLRPIEIARMELSDLSRADEKIIIKGKGSKVSVMPFESDVKAAIDRYVQCARPPSKSKMLFLTGKAPFSHFSHSAAISSIVRHAIERAGLKVKVHGARLLRYSVASAILNRGGNLMEVAELLRHSSLNTTARYTRLDFEKLKDVSRPWPGSAR
jgi:integrase/recombinase XerD